MVHDLDAIIEVQMCSAQNANQYLEAGYLLLGIYPINSQRTAPDGTQYTQIGVTFVVGRDESVSKHKLNGNHSS